MRLALLQIGVAIVLLAGIVSSGIALVTTAHESRRLFGELELLRREQDRLRNEWSALTLEVSTLAGHARIDTIAREQLGLIDADEHRLYVEVVP